MLQLSSIDAIKYNPVPFDKIPISVITSGNEMYQLAADYSIDYGDEVVIVEDKNAKQVSNLELHNNTLSLNLTCDVNDRCGTNLAPEVVRIYLVDATVENEHIIHNSVLKLELAEIDCGVMSIENCAKTVFIIPENLLFQNYKLVIDMSFDEAKWIFINPVSIPN
jgi:hypothetical protein